MINWRREQKRIRGILERARRIVVTSHRNADVDSVVSSELVRRLALELNSELEVWSYFPSVSSKAEQVVKFLKLRDVISEKPPDDFDCIVVVDAGSRGVMERCAELLDRGGVFKLLIDHHVRDPKFVSSFDASLVDEEASSSAEMVYRLARELDAEIIDDKLAVGLAAAVLVETSFFRRMSCRGICVLYDLCREGYDISPAVRLLTRERSFSERVAMLKGLKRMEIYRAGEWLVVASKLGAYRSEAAGLISSAGGDIVAVVGEDEELTKLHVRLSAGAVKQLGINAVRDLINELVGKFGGSGGGHTQVAQMATKTSVDELLSGFLETAGRILRKKVGEELAKME